MKCIPLETLPMIDIATLRFGYSGGMKGWVKRAAPVRIRNMHIEFFLPKASIYTTKSPDQIGSLKQRRVLFRD